MTTDGALTLAYGGAVSLGHNPAAAYLASVAPSGRPSIAVHLRSAAELLHVPHTARR